MKQQLIILTCSALLLLTACGGGETATPEQQVISEYEAYSATWGTIAEGESLVSLAQHLPAECRDADRGLLETQNASFGPADREDLAESIQRTVDALANGDTITVTLDGETASVVVGAGLNPQNLVVDSNGDWKIDSCQSS